MLYCIVLSARGLEFIVQTFDAFVAFGAFHFGERWQRDSNAVEAKLDDVTGETVKAAYDRAKRWQRRADPRAWHEQALVAARDGAKVIGLKRGLA